MMNLSEKQTKHLNLMKKFLQDTRLKGYVLKGGTSLLLHYGLDRFSEDIDLDSIGENPNIEHIIKDFCKKEGISYNLKKDTDTVYRVKLQYNDYHYPLKIEVSSRNSEDIKLGLYNIKNIGNYNIYDIKDLASQKFEAFGERDKIRDFYDIIFLVKNYRNSIDDRDILKAHKKLVNMDLDSIESELIYEVEKHRLFKEDMTTFVLDSVELLEKESRKIKQKQSKNNLQGGLQWQV